MDELPKELLFLMGIKLDYRTVINWCRMSKKFRQICKDPQFWAIKSSWDLGNPEAEFTQFYRETKDGHETYLQLAGKYQVAIPGPRNTEIFTD